MIRIVFSPQAINIHSVIKIKYTPSSLFAANYEMC